MIKSNIISPDWKVPDFIKAVQTNRKNGFSVDNKFKSFNLSNDVGDNERYVALNMRQIRSSIPDNFTFIKQNHGKEVIKLPNSKASLLADACYTNNKNVVCTILTADCLPIIITDNKGSFVSAIHAGWKGLGMGIIENAINKINSPNPLIAWLGPCICQEKFEVGLEVYDFFYNYDKNIDTAFKPKSKKKLLLSLTKAAKIKLKNYGVENLYGNSITQNFCTYKESNKFFSHRRDGVTGRMATLVWIEKK